MTTKLTDENSAAVYTRLPLDLVEKIEARAAEADRSVSGEVRHLIKLALTEPEASEAA